MSFWETIKSGVQNHFDKKKQDSELMEKLRKEGEIEAQKIFEEDFKKNQREVLIAKAKEDAAKLSGLQKMRAEKRLRHLNKEQNPGSVFSRMRDHTQKNLARTQERLKETEARKEATEKLKQENMLKRQERDQRTQGRKPFSQGFR